MAIRVNPTRIDVPRRAQGAKQSRRSVHRRFIMNSRAQTGPCASRRRAEEAARNLAGRGVAARARRLPRAPPAHRSGTRVATCSRSRVVPGYVVDSSTMSWPGRSAAAMHRPHASTNCAGECVCARNLPRATLKLCEVDRGDIVRFMHPLTARWRTARLISRHEACHSEDITLFNADHIHFVGQYQALKKGQSRSFTCRSGSNDTPSGVGTEIRIASASLRRAISVVALNVSLCARRWKTPFESGRCSR